MWGEARLPLERAKDARTSTDEIATLPGEEKEQTH